MRKEYELKINGLKQGTNRKKILFYISDTGCFICTSHCVHHTGYPQIYHNRRVTNIARMLMETKYLRKLPEYIEACHNCNNKMCINPDHIRMGTKQANKIDCRSIGNITGQKLLEEDVKGVRALHETGDFSQRELGDLVGVGQDHISRIVNNKVWR